MVLRPVIKKMPFKKFFRAITSVAKVLKTVGNIAKEAIKARVVDVDIT